MMHPPFGHDLIFTLVPVFILAVFGLMAVTLIVRLAKGLGGWSDHHARPVLTQQATVTAKRLEVSGPGGHSTATRYFATFELAGGDRREFPLSGAQYGLLADGDAGRLRFQGSRFLGFDREAAPAAAGAAAAAGPDLVCAYCGAHNPPGAAQCASCGSPTLIPQPPPAPRRDH